MDYCDGVQHIGIPTADMAATCKFYEELGFENVHRQNLEKALSMSAS